MANRGRRPPLDVRERERSPGVGPPISGGQMLLLGTDDAVARRLADRLGRADGLGLSFLRCRDADLCVQLAAVTTATVCVADLTTDRSTQALAVIGELAAVLRAPLVAIVGPDGPSPVLAVRSGADDVIVTGDEPLDPGRVEAAVALAMARSRRPSTQPGVGHRSVDDQPPTGAFDDFARSLAHDLRAPVRTARRHVRTARRGSTADQRTDANPIDLADQALLHLDELIVSVLDFATIGAIDLELEPIKLAQIVEETVDDLAADLMANGGTVVIDIDASITVLAQGPQLKRVFLNLLGNSIRHSGRTVGLVIAVSATRSPGFTTIRVADNGVGIPADDADQVFVPLYRVADSDDAPRRGVAENGGLGLGLALCARIVTNAGGVIRSVPGYGPGATFEVGLLSPIDHGRR